MACWKQSRILASCHNERLGWERKRSDLTTPKTLRLLPDLSGKTLERLRTLSPAFVDEWTEALFKKASETKVPLLARLLGRKDQYLLRHFSIEVTVMLFRLDDLLRSGEIHIEHSAEELELLEKYAEEIARLTDVCSAETANSERLAVNMSRIRTALLEAAEGTATFRPEFLVQTLRLAFRIGAILESAHNAESRLHALMLEQDIQEPFLTV